MHMPPLRFEAPLLKRHNAPAPWLLQCQALLSAARPAACGRQRIEELHCQAAKLCSTECTPVHLLPSPLACACRPFQGRLSASRRGRWSVQEGTSRARQVGCSHWWLHHSSWPRVAQEGCVRRAAVSGWSRQPRSRERACQVQQCTRPAVMQCARAELTHCTTAVGWFLSPALVAA